MKKSSIAIVVVLGAAAVAALAAFLRTQGLRSTHLVQQSITASSGDPTSVRLRSAFAKHGWVSVSLIVAKQCAADATENVARATIAINVGSSIESSESATLDFSKSSTDTLTVHFHPRGTNADALLVPNASAVLVVPIRARCGDRTYRMTLRSSSAN